MNKDRRRSHQRNPQQGIRIEEKKWVVKPDDEDNQSHPPRQQLNNDFSTETISEFIIQPALESARKHPKSNGFEPNQQPHAIEKTAEPEVAGLSVYNKEKQQEEEVRGSEQKSKDEEVDVTRSRLEEIKLVAREPKLSEEQLRVNDRLQEEEILAMEAIYGENVIVLDRDDGLRSFQINIHIEVPGKLVMYTEIGSVDGEVEFGGIGNEAVTTPDNSNGFFYSFEVQYLPPIILTCLLPKAYPSNFAPFFTISVQWLDTMKISSLCQMLDKVWMGQSGQEILYPWVDWLQNSSLSHLEFDNRIPLASFEKADSAGDRRAISENISPYVNIRSMLNYNEDKCNEKFCQNLHECCICLSESAGTRFIRLPCKHFFCRNCLETYSTMHAKEGGAIQCPQIKCRELVPPNLVKSLLGDEKFEQWESLLFHKTLDSMSDLVYCPRCEMACLKDEDHLVQCPKCFFAFCGLCRDRLHVGVQCKTAEKKLKFSKEKLKSLQITQPAQNSQPEMTKEQRRDLDEINKLLSEDEITRIAKQCPKCSIAIYRSYGCNTMHCTKCGQKFCYKCGKKYDKGKLTCSTCKLFDFDDHTMRQQRQEREADELRQGLVVQRRQEEEEEEEEEVVLLHEQRRILNQSRIENPANHAHPCPICRQINAKVENNNHIICWSCQTNYCYLCRKIVKRCSQHYGPKGCKQHSAG
ncbi:hypothetical protein MKW94_009107 [Papaver nudicaule]|uniref:RBR-type E3 ubiquitin transferase n=1 Tax=Papaver nudicaule TaxID=74823 RepID=A0AA41V2A0_PAPNU|nr:hypothetical protein [Papaver nudicaule]